MRAAPMLSLLTSPRVELHTDRLIFARLCFAPPRERLRRGARALPSGLTSRSVVPRRAVRANTEKSILKGDYHGAAAHVCRCQRAIREVQQLGEVGQGGPARRAELHHRKTGRARR